MRISDWRSDVCSSDLEDGWSLLYTHPLNRFDLPYRTITGLVDNDRYHDVFTHIPALWTDPDFVGTLPAGTPIAQSVPIRRPTLELATASMTPEALRVFPAATQSDPQSLASGKRLTQRVEPGGRAFNQNNH